MAIWDVIVRTFFSDSGLSAGLAKANAGLDQLRKTGPGARAGLRAVEIGARQLAFSAAGLSGGIGNLARGLLMFGGGSALMLGAVAGIGALALAYRHFTRDSREAAAAQIKLREELVKVAQAAREGRLPGTQRIATQQEQRASRFAELNALIATRQSQLSALVPGQAFAHETETQTLQRLLAGDKELNALYRERRGLGQDIRTEVVSAGEATKKEADELKRAADEARRLKLEAIEFLQATLQLERGGGFGGLPQRFTAPAFGSSAVPRTGGATTFANIRGNQPRFVPDPFPKEQARIDAQQIAQMAMMSLMMGARGGASGAFGAAGGLLSGISGLKGIGAAAAGPLGWAGFGLSALGSVFGLFDSSEERRHKEQMRELKKFNERPILEPTRFVLNIVDPVSGRVSQTMYEIGRREDRDAQDRIPGGP